MKHIAQFIVWKLKSKDFWLMVLGSASMYFGWQLRANMRESIWKSWKSGPLHK